MAYVADESSVAALRRNYRRDGFDRADLAETWRDQFEAWLHDAVAGDVVEPNAMTLATVDADGRPSARTVLLKGIGERGLVFFTNRTSRKGQALSADPRAALVVPWIALERQVCVTGDVEEISRAETISYASSRPRGSQLGAWISHQSRVIEGRAELERRRIELERRFGADVPVPEFWGGYRVLPLTVEFWQGREDRLHDRLRFRRVDGRPGAAGDDGWAVERLAP